MDDAHKVFLEECGIVVSDYRDENVAPTPETIRQTRARIIELCPGRKVPLLVLADVARGMDADMMDAVAGMADVVTRIAIVPQSSYGIAFAGDFVGMRVFPFPHRMFEREADARAWLVSRDG